MHKHYIESMNSIEVEAGTNCPQGGNWSHGGCTTIRLTDESCTRWSIVVDVDGSLVTHDQPQSIVLHLYGDTEAVTIAEALEFAASKIREDIATNRKRFEESKNK